MATNFNVFVAFIKNVAPIYGKIVAN